ncbi:MAG: hypothetical protein KDF48_02760 [Rhodocyclaceae bacterium]|nr:hypothetical protein [Rhodocyclaceae bacterium]
MNRLPEHRRAIHARTWARTWRHADFDPIERWPGRPRRWETAADIALALAIGVGLTLWMWEAMA